jgi:hypothetical protein
MLGFLPALACVCRSPRSRQNNRWQAKRATCLAMYATAIVGTSCIEKGKRAAYWKEFQRHGEPDTSGTGLIGQQRRLGT